MLNINDISKSYGARDLFSGISLTVSRNDRLAIIGRNGTGKTTLFEIIAGNIKPDSGNLTLKKGASIGYLPQDARIAAGNNLLEEVTKSCDIINTLQHRMRTLQEEMATETDDEAIALQLKSLGELQNLYDLKGGYHAEHEAEFILTGLGFLKSDYTRKTSEFSGGWQTRIELAKLLYCKPDILLLDEPTNHLDLESQLWFESYLKKYLGAVLFTSHDRTFLNNTANKIVSIENDEVIFYSGSYESYINARLVEIETRQAAAARQQRMINRQMRFIERFRAKATKATQVQSRIKQIEKIESVKVPRLTKRIHFNFPEPERSGKIVIDLKNICKSYARNMVYENLNLTLDRGDKAAIVGPNGAGKSTLLRIMAGVINYDKGERVLGYNVNTGYFAQYYVEMLSPENSVLEELCLVAPDAPESKLRKLLGSFLFNGDDVAKKVEVLSGGEKTRLAIARLLTKPANFLLLDEPTNHLDIPSREILADALGEYKGTFCIVTHDRSLIRDIANKIIEVKNGTVQVFSGNYDEYLSLTQTSPSKGTEPQEKFNDRQPGTANNFATKRQIKVREGEIRNNLYRAITPLNNQIAEIEREVDLVNGRIKHMEQLMASPAHYQDPDKVVATSLEYNTLKDRLVELTSKWDRLTDEAEQIKSTFDQEMDQLQKFK